MSARYYLANHVHIARYGENLLLLDLRRDDYSHIKLAHALALFEWADGQAAAMERFAATDNDGDVESTLNDMLSAGVVVASGAEGKRAATPATSMPTTTFLDDQVTNSIGMSPIDMIRYFSSARMAAGWQKRWSMLQIVQFIQGRKAGLRAKQPTFDVERARGVARKYETLRVFYPKPFVCLYDSLALLEFMAHYRLYPQWVYGVRTHPWGAHCWLQHEDTVINDLTEEVCSFTPIMAV